MNEPTLRHGAGIAGWAIHHPIGTVMLTLAVMVLGAFALERLSIDLLPRLIYPEVAVRVTDPGVPATIMEDEITRHLEEQLAVTEDAIFVQSETSEGRTSVDLAFPYGKDIDLALRDASTRLDRARRLLPSTIDPPSIWKRDPFQLPVAEYVVSSPLRDPVELRTWTDYDLGRQLLNLPGVAAAEVGGGLEREIEVLADPARLEAFDLDILQLSNAIEAGNQDYPSGRLLMNVGEIGARTRGRFQSVSEVGALPISLGTQQTVGLAEVAQVRDGAAEEKLRVRLDGRPGVKLAIQKQPGANTVEVVAGVGQRLAELQGEGLIPEDIQIEPVADQALYVRRALDNATSSALSGALLAMGVIYLFLGDLRRTLIIGSAIPISILVTFILMSSAGLSLNIMTLGGLALGVGMVVDNTIVMLENIRRHQREAEARLEPAEPATQLAARAAAEVNSAIVASTTTNLAAVLPFLFITGLTGLLFRELIFTISAATAASLVVAITLVPALAARVASGREGWLRRGIDQVIDAIARGYAWSLGGLLRLRWALIALFCGGLWLTAPQFLNGEQVFLPEMDEGRVNVTLTADMGINLDGMDELTRRIEGLLGAQPEVATLFTVVGGRVYGRSQTETPNRSTILVLLRSLSERGGVSSNEWITRVRKLIEQEGIAGLKVGLRTEGIRGIRVGRGEDDLALRIQGPDLEELGRLGSEAAASLRRIEGLTNVLHSYEEVSQELSVRVDRARAADFGLSMAEIGKAIRLALQGQVVSDFIDGDHAVDIRLRLERSRLDSPEELEGLTLFPSTKALDGTRRPIRLADIATIELVAQPATIQRERQQRVVEISAGFTDRTQVEPLTRKAMAALEAIQLPPGYRLYEAGSLESLQAGRNMGRVLLGLALFLVFVVMAVQYESLRNPLIILLGVPFALIGVVWGLHSAELPLSMPVWLGLIMLAGIVVNNAIILVEYIELERGRGLELRTAILEAARLRLRPILMTTLTTVVGMLPLALAWEEGSEMLQPLAVTMVAGLTFSTLVSLILIPCLYSIMNGRPRD